MNNKTFHYSYSPTEKQEIEAIRKKYTFSNEISLAQEIKRLDNSLENSGTVASILFGLIATLIFGLGLSLCIAKQLYTPGVIIGVLGIIGMGITPFLNTKIKEKNKRKKAKKMLALCDEYLKNN